MIRITEKSFFPLADIALTANGGPYGQIEIVGARLLRVGQLIKIRSNTQPSIQVKVNKILSETEIVVGEPKKPVSDTIDLTSYTTADSAIIFNAELSPRPAISPDDVIRAVYDEESSIALRSILVDDLGRYIGLDPDRPFHVQLSDGSVNIGTVNADLDVQLDHTGATPDSVQVGDGTETLEIKPDGSAQVGEGLFDSIQTLETGTSLASAFNTSSINVEQYSRGFLKAVWTGANDSNDATFVIEVSDNETDWSQLGESGMVLLQEADTQIWQILEFPARYMRLVYTENSNNAGTVNISFMGRY